MQHEAEKHSHYRGTRKRREKESESLFEEIRAESISNLDTEADIQIKEAQSSKEEPKKICTKTL